MRSSLSHSILLTLPGATSMSSNSTSWLFMRLLCTQTWFYWVGRSQTLPVSSDALWHIAWGNAGCQRVKYLLVFAEVIKHQSYICHLFITANKDTTEHFLELVMVGASTGLDFSGWLQWLKFRTESPIVTGVSLVLHYCNGIWSLTYICEGF